MAPPPHWMQEKVHEKILLLFRFFSVFFCLKIATLGLLKKVIGRKFITIVHDFKEANKVFAFDTSKTQQQTFSKLSAHDHMCTVFILSSKNTNL
jgi:hypothetical protein